MHDGDETPGELFYRLAVFAGAPDDLVVDIGDVADVGDLVTQVTQIAGHDIEHHHDPGVSQMTVVIDRHAADVHAHLALLEGDEGFLFTRQAVENLDRVHRGRRRYSRDSGARPW